MERYFNVRRHADRSRVGNQPLLRQLIQGVELRQTVGTVVDAGVLVHHLEPGENPDLVLHDRSADRSNIVLPRKGLLGLGRWVVDGEACIQSRCALKHREVAMPVIGAALGADDHRCGGGAANVGIRLRGLHRKFAHNIRRKVLQEAADVIVRVVHAIDGKLIVQAGAAARGHGRDTRLSGIGRLNRFRARHHVCDIGKATGRQRNVLQVLPSNYAPIHSIRSIEFLGGNGRGLGLHIDCLLNGRGPQGHQDVPHNTHLHRDVSAGFGKPRSIDHDVVVSWQQVREAEFATATRGCLPLDAGTLIGHRDVGRLNPCSAGVLHFPKQRARCILGVQRKRKQQYCDKPQDCSSEETLGFHVQVHSSSALSRMNEHVATDFV